MQIAFLTLFLGLTLGRYPVQLAVEGPVAAVELVLDGTPAGRVQGPPWTGEVDFGPGLQPHELVARALDARGQEIGSARQWINLPRPDAEVEIVLEPGAAPVQGAEARPAAARLAWQNLTGARPAIHLTLDGQPLAVGEDGRAPLPAVSSESVHVLSAELEFPSHVTARKDAVFGGRWGSEISAELTAVPVRLRGGRDLTPEALCGQLLADGQPLSVAAVEDSPAQVVIVRDIGAGPAIGELVQGSRYFDLLRYEMGLGKDDEVHLMLPVALASASSVPTELFSLSPALTLRNGGVFWVLSQALPGADVKGQRLADAVAVAGLRASTGNRPRAVVLVVSGHPRDGSRYASAVVRQYLETLRVPLFIWCPEKKGAQSPELASWGEVTDVSSLSALRGAVSRLKDALAAQRIVWVEGQHLPQSITAAAGAPFDLR
jgi:hypothetical protein